VEVLAISVDSQFTHHAWRKTAINDGGIGAVQYPLIADVKHEICKAYDVELEEEGVALRSSFLIDKTGCVRHQLINDLPFGRNIDEMLRMVDALQFHEEYGEVCPAQWTKEKAAIEATPEGVAEFLTEHSDEL
jgi:peroxiredoxin (alkyl hydroperoxide reductase subunit C)